MGFDGLCWWCGGTGVDEESQTCELCAGSGVVLCNDIEKNSFRILNRDENGKDIPNDNA